MVARPWRTYGPFDLDKHDERSWKKLFCDVVGELHPTLPEAIGVYIIGLKNSRNSAVRYIGMTHNQDFVSEIFSQRNLVDVWDIITQEKSKIVRIWLLAKPNEKRTGFSADARLKHQSHLLEQLMIMHARAAGHILINTKKMKAADGIAVTGLFGNRRVGAKSASAKSLSKALRLGR